MSTRLIRLLQLSSNTLPVGGFTYSQGIEWAVEAGWVTSSAQLEAWLSDLISATIQPLDIPILKRLYQACEQGDRTTLQYWIRQLIGYRETAEQRSEEHNRGRAMTRLLLEWDLDYAKSWKPILEQTQLAGLALAGQQWQIDIASLARGYAWSWLENLVISGVKLVPLGQAAGQKLLRDLSPELDKACDLGLQLLDSDIGSSTPAAAHASACHEVQYTRLYRS